MINPLIVFECLVYGVFAGCFVSAWRRDRFEAIELVWTAIYGFLLEWMTLKLLNAYAYGSFAVMLDGAPLCVALGWAVIIYAGMRLSSQIHLPDAVRPLLDALLALNVDLTLDTIAVRLGMWSWSGVGINQQWFGVPWANFWAWFLVVWSYSAFLRALRSWRSHRIRRWLYPPLAMIMSLIALATASGLYPLFPDTDSHALVSLFVLTGSLALILGAKPRWLKHHRVEPIVVLVPLAFHGFALVIGISDGIFERLPVLAVIAVAMMVIGLAIHGPALRRFLRPA